MGNYPWGPHGPQSGPNEVTPNPTPAYVPPPMPSYDAPVYGSPGPVGSGGGFVAHSGPRRKGYFFPLILALLFGPLGLFYTSGKGALAMLLFLVGVPVGLSVIGVLPFGSVNHPFAVLDHSSVMDGMWKISVVFSMVWAAVAVNRHNARIKAS
jgi:hypothetical protein